MPEIPFPRGMRDLLPNEALFRNELLAKVEDAFRLFGFVSIDTPTMESLQVLKAKGGIGSESKLIFETNEQLGLRYDHTVSLARYMAMHQELPMPFKRYYIGKVWRREEPQRLRYREFTQADVDVIGGNDAAADAEVIAACAFAIAGAGIECSVLINDRKLIEALMEKIGVDKPKVMDAVRAIDKLDKAGSSGVSTILKGLGIPDKIAEGIISLVKFEGGNEEKLSYADKLLGNGEMTKGLRELLALLEGYSSIDAHIDFSIVRGLDYYTGTVFEYVDRNERGLAIGGGGRYDGLAALYGSKRLPAVGASIGIDRILEMLNFSASLEYTHSRVFVANVSDKNYAYALKVANLFRAAGIPTEINIASRNLSNQLSYANAIKVRYAAFVGDSEEKSGKVKLRDLSNGTEALVFIDEAIKTIKGE